MGDAQALWQRRLEPLTTVFPYVLLAVLTVSTYLANQQTLLDLGLCTLAAVWIMVLFTLRPAWRERPRVMETFLAGLLLITLVLAIRNPWFGFYTPVCYLYAFRIIRWPTQLYFITGSAVVAGTAQANGLDLTSLGGILAYAAILLVNAVPLGGTAWLGQVTERREREREAALAETSAANERLAAALRENADLQQQLLTQARTAGVLDERHRMAREIHDTLAQGLIGIITQLQAADAADSRTGWQRHHDSATALARESLTEARRSVNALRPQPLDTGRLDDALASVTAQWSQRHNVPAAFVTTGPARPLPPEAETVLLRTTQEALANVARHASATRVGITLSYLPSDITLDIRDDGCGFDPAPQPPTRTTDSPTPTQQPPTRTTDAPTPAQQPPTRTTHAPTPTHQPPTEATGGFGLEAMRQRIEGLSGTLDIESSPGAGTTITARLPLAP
ncbi:sensor histidine kinase [Actinoplanes sp. N902-109]|uniref:sensor histidine kinase n=1 Tax=Actinoplanes sp. (strain N902-109) TaxID=649831 RepID=UPI0003293843|nr:sensor histidine kinase [Actinoplanes sp. N902-109]AGL19861.1 AzicR1 [Actinoplanes sp. N902-109]